MHLNVLKETRYTFCCLLGESSRVPILAYCLTGALAFSIILLLVLAFTLYKLKKQICSVCKGTIFLLEQQHFNLVTFSLA